VTIIPPPFRIPHGRHVGINDLCTYGCTALVDFGHFFIFLIYTQLVLHNEELHNLYSSPSIIRMIKSRKMKWAGHVRMGEKRSAYRILVGMSEGKR
jgi:hypothetical protein